MCRVFEPWLNLSVFSLEYKYLTQRKMESVQTSADRVRLLLSNMGTDKLEKGAAEIINNSAKVAYLKGLNPQIRAAVVRTAPKDFSTAITNAVREQANALHFGTAELPKQVVHVFEDVSDGE